MKTDGINPLEGGHLKKTKPAEKIEGTSFDKIFQNATTGIGKTPEPNAPGMATPLPEIPLLSQTSPSGTTKDLLASLEKTLTDLDMFGSALGNEEIPLERLKSIVGELLARKEELAGFVAKTNDEELKTVAKDVLSTIMDQATRYEAGYAG